jgi:ribosome modulation factor
MGRKKKDGAASSAPKQTLEGLSDDQRYSLVEQHRQTYERLTKAKDDAGNALKNFGRIVKADLGKDGMAEIKGVIEGSTPQGETAIKARIERDVRILRWMQVPIGTMEDLFPANDRTPITERAFKEGKRQGLAGESCDNPHHHTTEAHRSFESGYAEGQTTLAQKGFSKLADTPSGSMPRDQWAKKTAEETAAVEAAIKTGTVHLLGTKAPTHTVTT